jgi:hypothetical protein
MNRRFWRTLACGALAAVVAAPLAFAQEQSNQPARGSDRPNVRAATTRVAADAPGARLAGLIRNDGFVLRNKGIHVVTKPTTGVFCITPTAASGINPSTAVVQVTVDWSRTRFNEALVQWGSIRQFCAASQIEIHTLMDVQPDAVYTHSDLVSFSIIVP